MTAKLRASMPKPEWAGANMAASRVLAGGPKTFAPKGPTIVNPMKQQAALARKSMMKPGSVKMSAMRDELEKISQLAPGKLGFIDRMIRQPIVGLPKGHPRRKEFASYLQSIKGQPKPKDLRVESGHGLLPAGAMH
jgi:hypothetical protein